VGTFGAHIFLLSWCCSGRVDVDETSVCLPNEQGVIFTGIEAGGRSNERHDRTGARRGGGTNIEDMQPGVASAIRVAGSPRPRRQGRVKATSSDAAVPGGASQIRNVNMLGAQRYSGQTAGTARNLPLSTG